MRTYAYKSSPHGDCWPHHGDCAYICIQIVNKVGWDAKEGEGHLISMLRTLVLGAAGKYGTDALQRKATLFAAHALKCAL
jgi:hypothetical protein